MIFGEVTGRVYGHWTYDHGHQDVLEGFLNAADLTRMERMSRVAESAAGIVMASVAQHSSLVEGDTALHLRDPLLIKAYLHRQAEAYRQYGFDPTFSVELMALNYHLEHGGFDVCPPQYEESQARVLRAFPRYGDIL